MIVQVGNTPLTVSSNGGQQPRSIRLSIVVTQSVVSKILITALLLAKRRGQCQNCDLLRLSVPLF